VEERAFAFLIINSFHEEIWLVFFNGERAKISSQLSVRMMPAIFCMIVRESSGQSLLFFASMKKAPGDDFAARLAGSHEGSNLSIDARLLFIIGIEQGNIVPAV